ncbi:MAG TPA: PilZ domain-containing protein [Sphingomicrobium sp.]|nr:PilZ domain-containing protein [Sphingomicrobium sp.]
MGAANPGHKERRGETRRQVVIPARLRSGAQWSDACILNISQRGMMIHSGFAGPRGSTIELCRGDHVIVARVVWRDGARAGLHSDERVPAEQIMALTQSANIRALTSDGVLIERRRHPRPPAMAVGTSRQAFDFAFAFAVMLLFALGIWDFAQRDLAFPPARIGAVLARHF